MYVRIRRFLPFLIVLALTAAVAVLGTVHHPAWWWGLVVLGPLTLFGVFDFFQRRDVLRRNYPLSIYFRYFFDFLGPYMHRYFVEGDTDGRPFDRETRNMVYARANRQEGLNSFGSERDFYGHDFTWLHHSIGATPSATGDLRIEVGAGQCTQPYSASLLNISALSFGALGARAVEALNLGAKIGGFAQDTGEGGLSKYHSKHDGDLIWEVGTGYFGCRTPEGGFDADKFADTARSDPVKMVELKLSQGAKPGHGGILPGQKVTEEIAEARGVAVGEECVSPNAHSVFSSPKELLEFIARMRELSGGKPAGFKLCVGHPWEFLAICKAMVETGLKPDFIVIDGAEGGTGAAPVEFPDHVGMPLVEGLSFVHSALVGTNLRDGIRLGASGKVTNGFSMAKMLSLGADWCNAGRAFMFTLGCVQSQRCHTDTCPTGITTQDPMRQRAISVEYRAQRVANYHGETLKVLAGLVASAGLNTPNDLKPYHLYRRMGPAEIQSADTAYNWLLPGQLLDAPEETPFAAFWRMADPDRFRPKQ